MEKAGHTEGHEDITYDEHDPAKPHGVKGNAAQRPEEEIHGIAVDDRHGEGQQVPPIQAAHAQAKDDEHHALYEILHNADAEAAPQGGDGLLNDEGGRGDHGYAKVGFTADGDAEGDEYDAEEPEQLGGAG